MRMPYQILLFPFILEENRIYYALFKRADLNVWQGISGGGEEGETPIETVKREALEEGEIPADSTYLRLASMTAVPVVNIPSLNLDKKIIVVPELSFAVELKSKNIKLSSEHSQYQWFDFEEATEKLKWDSNKNALWELNCRLLDGKISNADDNIKVIKKYI